MRRFLVLIALLCPCLLSAQTEGLEALQQELEDFANDVELQYAGIGFYLLNPEEDRVVASLNPKQSLIPASIMKAVTTATVMDLLGAEHKFQTTLAISGSVGTDSTLNGNVYIIGGGDPSLGSELVSGSLSVDQLMKRWVGVLKEAGIAKINGAIIADASIFDNSIPDSWNWGDIGNYYGAGANGLSFHDNSYKIYFKSGSTGSQTSIVKTEPAGLGLYFDNQVKAGASGTGDNAYIFGGPDHYGRTIKGTIPPHKASFSIKGSVPQPGMMCGLALLDALAEKGISVRDSVILYDEDNHPKYDAKALDIYQSPPLKDIVELTNMRSNNLYAEHLLKHIGLHLANNGSTGFGTSLMKTHWASKGVEATGFFPSDGSGLSRKNAVNAKFMAEAMAACLDEAWFDDYLASMPVAGKSGTLTYLCRNTSGHGRVFAKSGSMTRIRAYAGYVETKGGQLLCFSIIVNNYSGYNTAIRNKIGDVLDKVAELR